jgi:carbamoyl-phosphate synthase large subunit
MNIFVTGAGGPAGINVVREALRLGHVTIAADCDPAAAGFHFADRSELLPRATDPHFGETLIALLEAHEVDVVLSTVVEELVVLNELHAELAALSVGHWGPTTEAIALCGDKVRFAERLAAHGVLTPESAPASTAIRGFGLSRRTPPGPWIVKPRDGRGSRDVHAVDTRVALRAAVTLTPNPMVQTRVTGREFSVDALIGANSQILGCAARWRDAVRGGISTAGTTFVDPQVEDTVHRAVRAAGVCGPANIQGFVSHDGTVQIIEINPRFSGALPLSLASGCDLVGQCIAGASGDEVDRASLISTPGVSMARVFDEIFTGAPASHSERTS